MKWIKRIVLSLLIIFIGGSLLAYGMGYRLIKMTTNSSMYPTLSKGDLFIVDTNFDVVEKNDIVLIDAVFLSSGNSLTKRVIATEGDVVRVSYDSVFVNDNYIQESYTYFDPETTNTPKPSQVYTVNKNELFVMGDNRRNSLDSRHEEFGMLPIKYVTGTVIYIQK